VQNVPRGRPAWLHGLQVLFSEASDGSHLIYGRHLGESVTPLSRRLASGDILFGLEEFSSRLVGPSAYYTVTSVGPYRKMEPLDVV
jgi:hypothetical protein